ncbi:4Fe-4S dicluster domain-containing protein [Methanosarcina lacustris]|uniref:4Fe-4S dicluster domain-containing protein n=1 Tax=Methanosarcina lacustris TaxID=170861 RepID=UPI000A059010
MVIKMIDPGTCIGCGTCVATCPTDVIRMNYQTKHAVIMYPEDCEICHMCVNFCPVDAITVTEDKSMPILIAWG